MSNIKKVSEVAGVSIATVSRTLRSPDLVAESTREKVMKAVEAVNYQPNVLAQNFRTRRANAILVLVPNIANPFFSPILRSIQSVARQKGYAVLLGDTDDNPELAKSYLNFLTTRQADGVIQMSHWTPRSVREGVQSSAPFVYLCETPDDLSQISVTVDNVDAARKMTAYLADSGHKRIGLITGPKDSPLTHDRLQGWRDLLSERNLPHDESLIASGDFSLKSGAKAAEELLSRQKPLDAIFCMNDEMAMGAIRQLSKRGIRVPDDISVAGFDDIELSDYYSPTITTMSQPKAELGKTAVEALINEIEGKDANANKFTLNASLIVRDSTKTVN